MVLSLILKMSGFYITSWHNRNEPVCFRKCLVLISIPIGRQAAESNFHVCPRNFPAEYCPLVGILVVGLSCRSLLRLQPTCGQAGHQSNNTDSESNDRFGFKEKSNCRCFLNFLSRPEWFVDVQSGETLGKIGEVDGLVVRID